MFYYLVCIYHLIIFIILRPLKDDFLISSWIEYILIHIFIIFIFIIIWNGLNMFHCSMACVPEYILEYQTYKTTIHDTTGWYSLLELGLSLTSVIDCSKSKGFGYKLLNKIIIYPEIMRTLIARLPKAIILMCPCSLLSSSSSVKPCWLQTMTNNFLCLAASATTECPGQALQGQRGCWLWLLSG